MAPSRVLLSGVLLAVAACTSVKPVHPAEFIPAHHPPTVWVTYTDYSYVPVAQPRMIGDTLKGMWEGLEEPLVIPLSQIQTVQARVPDYERTIILFCTLGAIVGGVVLANRAPQ